MIRPLPTRTRRLRTTALVAVAMTIPALAASDATNGSWEQLTPTGSAPPWRKYFAAVHDPIRERLVVDGKWPDLYDDTWALTLSGTPAWTQMWPSTGVARQWHAGIYDPPRDRMLAFGWYDGEPFGYHNEVLALTFSGTPTKSTLSPTANPPSGRVRHSAIYDPVRDRMLIFGGLLWGSGTVNEVWELGLGGTPTWNQLVPSGTAPSARVWHSSIYDPLRDVMLVFGGSDATGLVNDLWQLTLGATPTWSAVAAAGTPPPGRSRHSAIYDPVRDRMVVFGGYSPGNVQMNDVWALSLSGTPTWSQLAPDGTPPLAREGHEAIYDAGRDRMVVYGGQLPPEDLWALNWGTVVAVGPPFEPPGALTLQAGPSPAPTHVTVEFSLPDQGAVRLRVYDVRGRSVSTLFDGPAPAGPQRVLWNGNTGRGERAAPGVYFLHLRSASGHLTRRVLLID
jgi:Kelch motif protein/galactose oxidase-like protein